MDDRLYIGKVVPDSVFSELVDLAVSVDLPDGLEIDRTPLVDRLLTLRADELFDAELMRGRESGLALDRRSARSFRDLRFECFRAMALHDALGSVLLDEGDGDDPVARDVLDETLDLFDFAVH